MSSKTNQSSTPSGDQHMPGLELLSAATSSESSKVARETFLGRERPAQQNDTNSEEVTAGETPRNTQVKENQDLSQCHWYKIKGKKDSRCKQPATVWSYQGIRNYLVYCAECWKIRREANIKSCKQRRVTKKQKSSTRNRIFLILLIKESFGA